MRHVYEVAELRGDWAGELVALQLEVRQGSQVPQISGDGTAESVVEEVEERQVGEVA